MQVFLSSLSGRKAYDASGDTVATIQDLTIGAGQSSPEVRQVILRTRDGLHSAGAGHLVIGNAGIICDLPHSSWQPFESCPPDEVRLVADVVDKQVIDIGNRRVIRVNDIQLEYSRGGIKVVAVCVGAPSFLRRLLGERLASLLPSAVRSREKVIDWRLVQPLGSSSGPVRLTVSWDKTAPLHPADLADLMEDLDSHEQMAILNTLDNEKAADTLAKIEEDDLASSIIRRLDPDKASDIIEEMSPDDAADLLSDLPKTSADAILSEMEQPSRSSVSRLMEYDERTAGGIMTTEYYWVRSGVTVEGAIARVREISDEAETVYYGYVVDRDDRLTGVFSLRDLLVAQPRQAIEEVMTTPVLHVGVEASDGEVVDVMSKYDLLALPVTDTDGHMLGIITVDDVIDVLMERGVWVRVFKGKRQ